MEKLNSMIKYAYRNVPIYVGKLSELRKNIDEIDVNNWEKIPLITKDDYLKNNSELGISIQYRDDYLNNKLLCSTTSGSTGKCLNTFWTDNTYNKSLAELWLFRKKIYGINPTDRMCYFYSRKVDGEKNIDNIIVNEGKNKLGFRKNRINCFENVKKIYEIIKEFNPVWMMLQPSIAIVLAKYCIDNNLNELRELKYIESSGEILLPSVKRMIEEAFGCFVINQYGMNEVNSIAYECKCGRMHCMKNNVFVEVLDEYGNVVNDEKEGDIYVTSLVNRVMPYIRYKTGDRGRIFSNTKCDCGLASSIIEISNGRSVDWVCHEDGKKTSSYVFCDVIENINLCYNNVIKQFQVEQVDIETLIFRLVLSENVNDEVIIDMIVDNLCEEIVSDLDIKFEIYDELFPDNTTGKLKFFISSIS